MNKEQLAKQFKELQEDIDREKAKVKNGEKPVDYFNAWLVGYLSGALYRFYGQMLDTLVE